MSHGERGGQTGAALARTMGGFGALMITLSGLSPTIGVFVVGSEVIRQAGTGVVICYLAAAVLGVAMALVYAELVSAFPETGAEYTIMGRTLGPAFGFAALGLNLTNFTVVQALSGLGVADYLDVVVPGLPARGVALVLVGTVTLLAILNIRVNAAVTGAFLAVEVASLIALAWLGFAHPRRTVSAVLFHPEAMQGGKLAITSLAVMGASAAAAIYAFDGYGGVCSVGEEVVDAPRRVAGVIFWALGLAVVLQVTPMLAVATGASDGTLGATGPLRAFIQAAGGPVIANVLSIGVALAVLNAMLALALMAGRQLYATGRDQVWSPAVDAALTRLHPRFRSPWIATLAMGAASLAWCFAPLDFLVTVIAGATVATYAGLCVAVMFGRRRGTTRGGVFRMPLYPSAPAAALAGLTGVAWVSVNDPTEGLPGLAATALVIVVSLLLYRWMKRRGGRWADRGPGRLV